MSTQSELDYVFKKDAASLVKTDNATTVLGLSQEKIYTSPIVPGSNIWAQSDILSQGITGAVGASVCVFQNKLQMKSIHGGTTNVALLPPDNYTSLYGTAWQVVDNTNKPVRNWVSAYYNADYEPKFYYGTISSPNTFFVNSSDYPFIFDYTTGVLTFLNGPPNINLSTDGSGYYIFISGYTYTGTTLSNFSSTNNYSSDITLADYTTTGSKISILNNNQITIQSTGASQTDEVLFLTNLDVTTNVLSLSLSVSASSFNGNSTGIDNAILFAGIKNTDLTSNKFYGFVFSGIGGFTKYTVVNGVATYTSGSIPFTRFFSSSASFEIHLSKQCITYIVNNSVVYSAPNPDTVFTKYQVIVHDHFIPGVTTVGANATFTINKVRSIKSNADLGYNAGLTGQQANSVAIGIDAGATGQSYSSVAIGPYAGQNNQLYSSVAIGNQAGNFNQSNQSVAIGYQAGQINQQVSSVAIGNGAGGLAQGQSTVAIGNNAGYNGQGGGTGASIAIGPYAGYTGQGANAVAIGNSAGYVNQGNYSVAIGYSAGGSNQANNSIVLNASSTGLSAGTTGLFVKPVRGDTGTIGNLPLYNTSTGEIFYGPSYYYDGAGYLNTGNINVNAGNLLVTGGNNISISGTGAIYIASNNSYIGTNPVQYTGGYGLQKTYASGGSTGISSYTTNVSAFRNVQNVGGTDQKFLNVMSETFFTSYLGNNESVRIFQSRTAELNYYPIILEYQAWTTNGNTGNNSDTANFNYADHLVVLWYGSGGFHFLRGSNSDSPQPIWDGSQYFLKNTSGVSHNMYIHLKTYVATAE